MKNLFIAAGLLLAATTAVTTASAAVTVRIGQPGFYGRIDVGDYPAPQLIYAQPVIVERARYVQARPIYLRVPPGHARNWSKHCRRYNACNQEVYFVQDSWYNNQYAPRYRQQHARPPMHRPQPQHHGRPDHGPGRGPDRGHDRGPDRDRDRDRDHHDNRPGNHHGNDRGHGRGNDHRDNGHRN